MHKTSNNESSRASLHRSDELKKRIKKVVYADIYCRTDGSGRVLRWLFVVHCVLWETGRRSIGRRIPITPQATRSPEFLNEVTDRSTAWSTWILSLTQSSCSLDLFLIRDHLHVHVERALGQRTSESTIQQCIHQAGTYSIGADQWTFWNSQRDLDLTERIALHIAEVAPMPISTFFTSMLIERIFRWARRRFDRSSLPLCCRDWNEHQHWYIHWSDHLVRGHVSRNDCLVMHWQPNLRSAIHHLSNGWRNTFQGR